MPIIVKSYIFANLICVIRTRVYYGQSTSSSRFTQVMQISLYTLKFAYIRQMQITARIIHVVRRKLVTFPVYISFTYCHI
jgi:hypothetical protein